MRQLENTQPSFSSFFTNHVASSMHRFWAANFPEDYAPEDFGYEDDWINTYRYEIDWSMQKADQFADNPFSQDSSTIGDCSSSGHCGIDQTASINGSRPFRQQMDCTNGSCSSVIVCDTEGGCGAGGFAPVALNTPGTYNRREHEVLPTWSGAARSSSTYTSRFATPALLT